VRRRIRKVYRRESQVIHPPVAVESFYWKPPGDYYLAVGEMVPYKRLDLAVRVFSSTGRRLRIVGGGPEYTRLRRLAAPNIEFCGRASDAELREHYSRCRALVVPGEEDFGITLVEAMASGKPVVALERGGAVEIVSDSGVLFDEASEDGLAGALQRFESLEHTFRPADLQSVSRRYHEDEFARKMGDLLRQGRDA
jgi:glycosyltransferase involved in cell wall biosynthesis